MNTHSIRIKAIVLSIVFTMCVLVVPCMQASADSFPSSFYVNNNSFYTASEIYVRYNSLNAEQRDIANYLLGMYNLMYLGSRGFEFEAGAYTSQSSFIAKVKAFGYRIFYNASGVALQSRMDDNFLKYASAVLLYASQCNTTFDTWFENLDDDFIIPVDQGILNSFTLLYNDNSAHGVATYGDVSNPWVSGTLYNFAFEGASWVDNAYFTQYQNFVNTYDPIMYSNSVYVSAANQYRQYILYPLYMGDLIDSLYVQKVSDTQYYYRFATEHGFLTYNASVPSLIIAQYPSGQLAIISSDLAFRRSYFSYNGDLSDTIEYAFTHTPFTDDGVIYSDLLVNWYPYISHVYLVPNINSTNDRQEVFNNDSWDIVGLDGNMIVPIDTVNLKPKVLTTINLPDNSYDVSIQDMINDDNVVDDNGDPVNPWQINIVVQPNDTNPISIDVNLFSNGSVYLDYLWEHTKKMVLFAKDLLDCFEYDDGNGDSYGPKYAIYGVLVLGVAGGMIAKFLL